MAKSLRSKWKRKMRAVKRERYEKKELQRLNDMLTKAGELGTEIKSEEDDEMIAETEGDEGVSIIKSTIPQRTISIAKRRSRWSKSNKDETDSVEEDEEVEKMSVDALERVFNKRTMRDQFGNYPAWMNKRKMRTQQKKNKRLKKKAVAPKKK